MKIEYRRQWNRDPSLREAIIIVADSMDKGEAGAEHWTLVDESGTRLHGLVRREWCRIEHDDCFPYTIDHVRICWIAWRKHTVLEKQTAREQAGILV